MTRAELKAQVYGFLFAVAVAAIIAATAALNGADEAEIATRAFWTGLAVAVARSALTAAATFLGVAIPGVSPDRVPPSE